MKATVKKLYSGSLGRSLSSQGGKQIQVEDPDGNPIELFEPARR